LQTINIRGNVGADQGELLRSMALEGVGVVRLAEFHIGADIQAGRLVRLLADYQPAATDMMYALYPPGRVPAPRVKIFLDFLQEHFAGRAYTRPLVEAPRP
jgi:DNA-binding transcriptional LysR family regulator